jgi:hypothetical protein
MENDVSKFDYLSEDVNGVTLDAGKKGQQFSSSISNSTLTNCTLNLYGSGDRKLFINEATFNNCKIYGKKASTYFLHSASWKNCSFEGRFLDCVFGDGPKITPDGESTLVEISSCCFKNATLHIVEFRGGLNYHSCSWPNWPITAFHIDENKELFKSAHLPVELKGLLSASFSERENDWLIVDMSMFDSNLDRALAACFRLPGVFCNVEINHSTPNEEDILASKKYYDIQYRNYLKYQFWQYISQSVSIKSIQHKESFLIIALESSKNSYIPLPPTFLVKLDGVSSFDISDAGFLLEEKNKRSFRVMGASLSKCYDMVSIKGHRKNLGTIKVAYEAIVVLDDDFKPLLIESLKKWW